MTLDQLNQIQINGLPNNTVPATIGALITNSLTYIFSAAAIALLIYLILGGFQLMTSRGDPKAAQGAQAKITNAVIGFVIVIFAFFIVQIFGQIFKLQGTFFGTIFGTK
jgi:Type IV secretion system pilin